MQNGLASAMLLHAIFILKPLTNNTNTMCTPNMTEWRGKMFRYLRTQNKAATRLKE